MRTLLKLCGVSLVCSLAVAAHAQEVFPNKPIRFIVQFAPGGTSDIVARLVGARLNTTLGQPVVVENRAGAAGNIAAEYVAKSKADGYTILVANNTIVTNPVLAKAPYDARKDFSPIAYVGSIPIVLAVSKTLKVNTTQELIDLVKKNPGKYAYSSCGAGTAQHLAGELFKQQAKVDLVHAPYKGCNPAVVDGVSGQVPILFNAYSVVKPHAGDDGALKLLAVTSAQRSSNDTKIQTIAEAGIKDFDAQVWFGFLAPLGLPPAINDKLREAIKEAMATPEIQQKLNGVGFDIKFEGPTEFATLIDKDLDKWAQLVKQAKIEVSP